MAPKSSSTKSQTLKQGTLSFASSKRTKSSNSVTKATKTAQVKKTITPRSRRGSTSSSEDPILEDVELTSSEEEERKVQPVERKQEGQPPPLPSLRPRTSLDKKHSNKPTIAVLQPKDSQENSQIEKVERPELSDKDPRWRKHYAVVREQMGYQRPSKQWICWTLFSVRLMLR
jgi:DNA polymerase delta subunit 4